MQCVYVLRIFWKKSFFERKKTLDFTNKRVLLKFVYCMFVYYECISNLKE